MNWKQVADVAQCLAKLIFKLTLVYNVQIFFFLLSFFSLVFYYILPICTAVFLCALNDLLHSRRCAQFVVVFMVEFIYCTNFIFFLPLKTIPALCWELAQLQDTYILQGIFWQLSLFRIFRRKYAFNFLLFFFFTHIMVLIIFVIKLI